MKTESLEDAFLALTGATIAKPEMAKPEMAKNAATIVFFMTASKSAFSNCFRRTRKLNFYNLIFRQEQRSLHPAINSIDWVIFICELLTQ